jgi:ribosomal-protein-alanine N-acetyltransferase
MLSGAQRLFRRGGEETEADKQWVVGYVGLWFMAGEAHITNIAVRAGQRRQGIGELLLISAIDVAVERDAQFMTLEVRPSNTEARALYTKYGFMEVGVRRGYYYDTGEDALLMTTQRLTSAPFHSMFSRLKRAHAQR